MRRSSDTYSAIPSASHAGVRPEVTPASAAWVSSWVTTRCCPSASSVLNGGHTTTRRWETTELTRWAEPVSCTSASEIAASDSTPRMRSVSDRAACDAARDDHEVAVAQPRLLEHLAHARVAALERVEQRAELELERREHDEVLRAPGLHAPELPRMALARARLADHAPAGAGAARA